MSYLIDIGTAVPKHIVSQESFAAYYASLFEDSLIQRKIKYICHRSEIHKRHTVIPDLNNLMKQTLVAKMNVYFDNAIQLAIEAIDANAAFEQHKNGITDIITVSCTGMKAPGIEFDIINHFGLSPQINRYNVNFMGCYAAIIALRMAHIICQQKDRNVLIVSTELCTLHFQNNANNDYLLSNALFADGAASAIISSSPQKQSLKFDGFHSAIIPQTQDKMSWKISEHGFIMSLSNTVPELVQTSISLPKNIMNSKEKYQWAIHPGGRQILEAVRKCFDLHHSDLNPSKSVLRDYGNMSSATILFILSQMLPKNNPSKLPIIGCAFGPGLTFESLKLSHGI